MYKISIDKSWRQIDGKYKCPYCGKKYSKKGISTHIWRSHTSEGQLHKLKGFTGKKHKKIWNQGLTKNTDERIRKYGHQLSQNIKDGKTIPSFLGKTHSEKTKKKISVWMKNAHKEGRCWNIGFNKWNREPSWPEKWFSNVIKNEFIDKNYTSEHQMFLYSIDFAWIHKKIAIEIDGEQHNREPQKSSDPRKDKYLIENGWIVFRMPWKEVFKNPKLWIMKAKNLIDGADETGISCGL